MSAVSRNVVSPHRERKIKDVLEKGKRWTKRAQDVGAPLLFTMAIKRSLYVPLVSPLTRFSKSLP